MRTKNQAAQRGVDMLSRFTELTEDEARAVSGGGGAAIYYDVSTGTYILRPAGSVYVGPGLFVGTT